MTTATARPLAPEDVRPLTLPEMLRRAADAPEAWDVPALLREAAKRLERVADAIKAGE
jgi:hypothetical protein